MSEGWICLHRGWRDNPLFKGEFSRADAWVWLIENACWKPTRTRIKGDVVELQRGELTFAQRFLAEKWGWSKSRVDRFIADLREESMIETRSKIGATAGHNAGQGQCIITICNYAKYQDVADGQRGNDSSEIGATAGQQRGKEEQGNKETIEPEEEVRGAGKPRARRSPVAPTPVPDWVPAAQWAAFVDMRKKQGKPPTDHAVALLIGKLSAFRSAGHDPGQVLDQSTLKSWLDIFPPKDKPNAKPSYHSSNRAPDNDEPTNPYVRAALARQAGRAAEVGGKPDSWA